MNRNILGLFGWIGLCFGAAAIGAFVEPGPWYAQLRKPPWNPPAWLFGPVWSALYLMMGFAAWRIWRPGGYKQARTALNLFLLQLFLNAIWTPLFFGLHQLLLGALDIVLLWIALFGTITRFFPRDTLAGWLLVPYLGWVTFAGLLNFTLWQLNR